MSIFDGLMNPASAAGAFYEGMDRGKAEREERDVKGALAAYASNPDDPSAFRTLAQYKPEFAIKIREDTRKRQMLERQQQLQRSAVTGDKAALAELAGIDLDAWDKLSDNDRQAAKQQNEIVGQAALMADTPEEWDRQVERLVASGIDVSAYRGRFDLREATIAKAGLAKQFLDMTEPRYQAVPEGGTLVNTNDPNAVRSFSAGQQRGNGSPPSSAVDYLRKNPNLKSDFDAKYGSGAADRILGGAGGNVSSGFLDGI